MNEILFRQGRLLPLMELFYTLQGEGYHTGEAAVFIRLGGCDVGCRWCDVKESWNPDLHPLTETEKIIEEVCAFPSPNVVITGGEPLKYQLDTLCEGLHNAKYSTFLETSGAEPMSGKWDWVCLSPKRAMPPLPDFFGRADELKVIIEKEEDLDWAEENAELTNSKCRLYLQPEWKNRKTITPVIVDYIGSNPKWKLSLQMHKYIGIP